MALVNTNAALFAQSVNPEIAFLSDIHLQDVYADLDSKAFKGVFNPVTGKWATIRTMKSQLNSTRLFNENYFAFISALEDLREKGIKLVVLPGDFTDDGQPMNVLALKKILVHYTKDAGMRFFLTTGNHDPVKPFGGTAGKKDFLGTSGAEQAIAGKTEFYQSKQTAITEKINYWGYEDITGSLGEFGFYPNEKDLFWAHPFQELAVDKYNFKEAKESSSLENRLYATADSTHTLPDASYVVEPIEGIWLLALDGNVYTHSQNNWKGSSIGFNQAAIHKKHQLEWIQKVAKEAERRKKTLISFSHYPLVEFHDGASDDMESLFGADKFQLARVPSQVTTRLYAKTGIKIHFAGHMHINDTGVYHDSTGANVLYNVQVPSLAAFPPAYKTLSIPSPSIFEIKTIPLTTVKRMDEFFELYRMEHRWLMSQKDPGIWDSTILAAKNYLDYTQKHLKGLTKSRFIPADWPEDLALILQNLSPAELNHWATMQENEAETFLLEKVKTLKNDPNPTISHQTIIDDFYLLKNGDELGKKLISADRLSFYNEFIPLLSNKAYNDHKSLNNKLSQFFVIFGKLFDSLPSDHFFIDLKQHDIKRIEN
ncbi:metallophosphoesterase [Echinicola marina]|nr:metallophosphoesterase [Echinicola marina]